MSWTDDLVTGLAAWVGARGVGTWAPDDVIDSQVKPIVLGAPPDQPDVAIGLQSYDPGGVPPAGDVLVAAQFWVRGDGQLSTITDIGDDLYDAINAASDVTLGGVSVAVIYRHNIVSMGIDQNGRRAETHNYYLAAWRPTPARTY